MKLSHIKIKESIHLQEKNDTDNSKVHEIRIVQGNQSVTLRCTEEAAAYQLYWKIKLNTLNYLY